MPAIPSVGGGGLAGGVGLLCGGVSLLWCGGPLVTVKEALLAKGGADKKLVFKEHGQKGGRLKRVKSLTQNPTQSTMIKCGPKLSGWDCV